MQTATSTSRSGLRRQDIWTRREGAITTIAVAYNRGRFPLGEILVQTTYRLTDGTRDVDDSHRVYLANPTSDVIEAVWDSLFDEVVLAQQFNPSSTSIRLSLEAFPSHWAIRLRTIAQIIAYELGVIVKGTAHDSMRGNEA